jgi:predicted DNA-binding protein (MmcQ/YjbR family)
MIVEELINICSEFPAVTQDVKWGSNLCFCIGGKIFCIANLDPPHTFSFKVTDDEFEELSQKEGFKPAPYLAKSKWIMVEDFSKLSKKDLTEFLKGSYNMIKSKIPGKKRKELGLE